MISLAVSYYKPYNHFQTKIFVFIKSEHYDTINYYYK